MLNISAVDAVSASCVSEFHIGGRANVEQVLVNHAGGW